MTDGDLKCEVCGASPAAVCCSSMGPMSCAYCLDCLGSGAEPYGVLVAGIACIGINNLHPDMDPIIDASLKIAGKTRQDLERDVRKVFE